MIWIKGLIAALISGMVTALAGVLIDPQSVDFSAAGLKKMGLLALAGAMIGVVGYLKQSPMPVQKPPPVPPAP